MSAAQDFARAMRDAGVNPPDEIVADGQIHRFPTNGRRGDDAGWYVLHADGVPAGAFGDWRAGISATWHASLGRRLTPEEEAEQRRRIEEAKRSAEAEREKARAAAKKKAARLWDRAIPAITHGYLSKKRIKPHGARVLGGALVIPVFVHDEIVSLQFITETGEKRFLRGGEIRSGHFLIGDVNSARALLLCEGFATGATLHEATGLPVVVSFSSSNLEPVARTWRRRLPNTKMLIAGDDDCETPGNPGHRNAVEAARAVGAKAAFPVFNGERPPRATDFNDLAATEGIAAVRRIVEEALQAAPEPQETAGSALAKELIALAQAGDAASFWRTLDDDRIEKLRVLRETSPAEYCALRSELKAANSKIGITGLDALSRRIDSGGVTAATCLAELARERCVLWHDDDGEAFASFEGQLGETQHWRIESSGFRDWLARLAFLELGFAPGSETMKAAVAALAGIAKFEGETAQPARRVAKDEQGYWLDMCDERWRAILITPAGWRIVGDPPVRFYRSKTMRALPAPCEPGDVDLLWKLLNVPDEDERLLLLTWVLECWRPDTPFAVLEISGQQGSAKSTMQKILRRFVDPNEVALRGKPKTVEDIYVAAANVHLLSFENVSNLSAEQSDALCAISTGAGFATRRFYTNDEEAALKAHRPVVLNGVNPVVVRPDLQDRTVGLILPKLSTRITEEEIAHGLQRYEGAIFSGLLDLFCAALRWLPRIKAEQRPLPRMADFSQLGEAVARALGYGPGRFLAVYDEHRRDAVRRAVDASPVASALEAFARRHQNWAGTVGHLLEGLEQFKPRIEATDFWPKTPRGLGDALRRYAPALSTLGIEVEIAGKPSRDGYRVTVNLRNEGQSMFFDQESRSKNVNDVHDVHDNETGVNVVNVVNVIPTGDPVKKERQGRTDPDEEEAIL